MLKPIDSTLVNPVANLMQLPAVEELGAEFAKLAPKLNLPLLDFGAQSNAATKNASIADLSATGSFINQILRRAEAAGASAKFEAQKVITHTPLLPEQLAEDLKNAIGNSGLFYESHLADFAEGQRSLAEIKQEPQNQNNAMANLLLPQQLSILETQRLAWHGEVWPGQKMDWNINHDHGSSAEHPQNEQLEAISTDLTLQLPHLGKVTAKLSLIDGHMRIDLYAEDKQTLAMLKMQSLNLAEAIESNGPTLEGLTVASYD